MKIKPLLFHLILKKHKRLFRIMRITLIFLFISVFQLAAMNCEAQTASITLKNSTLTVGELIKEIEKQTDYLVVYSHSEIDVNRKLNLNKTKGRVIDYLNDAFSNSGIGHIFEKNYIILKGKAVKDQNQQIVKRTVKGIVTDESGEPLVGVTVSVKGTTNGSMSDGDGRFSLEVNSANVTLQVSYLGFRSREIEARSGEEIPVVLTEETKSLDEVVVVGYGIQKKVTLTGSVAAVKGSDVITTKNENVQNMLAGKIAGLRVIQNTAEPGSFSNSFDIRGLGSPLIVIDGVPRDNMSRLDANDIEDLSVLKDASAAAVYGVRGANGVVLITTKKGSKERMELQYSGSFGWQMPSGLPKTVDAIEYMTLRNEASMHKLEGRTLAFTDDHFAPFLNGTQKSTNWYKEVIRSMVPQTQHNITATGGSAKHTFYVSMGYQNQESFLRSGDLTYSKYNVRTNISSQLTNRIKLNTSIAGITEETEKPYESAEMITRAFWRMKPTQPVYANNNPEYYNSMGTDEKNNPVAMMSKDASGYNLIRNKWLQTTFDITYDVPYIEGLQAKGLFSYDYYLSDNKIFRKEYKLYEYKTDGTYDASTKQAPTMLKRENYSRQNTLWNISLNYNHTFAKKHRVGALLLMEQFYRKNDNFYAQRNMSIPLDQLFAGDSDLQEGKMNQGAVLEDVSRGIVGRFNYDFMSKYLVEFSFRRDGSSKFAPRKRWGFFPSGSLGWRMSEEGFWKKLPLDFIDNFKIRGSYGKLGDDGSLDYQFLAGYIYPVVGTARKLAGGYMFDDKFVTASEAKDIVNENITWFESKMFNIGFDFEAWNGLLGITFDAFNRSESGGFATRLDNLAGEVGASLPQENLNTTINQGFEVEINHRNKINDFSYNLKGIFSYSRRYRKHREKAREGNSYENWKDNNQYRWDGTWRAYGADGRFQSWQDIYNSPIYTSVNTLPGDYIYEDWNGDGIISSEDKYFNAYNSKPLLNYGLTVGAGYKNFDLNMLFQGAALAHVAYSQQLYDPTWSNGGMLEQFLDRWHPADPRANPYDPNTQWISGHFGYTGTNPDAESHFNIQDASYIRLKSIELGYTIPSKALNFVGLKYVRVYANAYNLFTLTGLKYVDPEHPSGSWGYLYPLNKTLTLGANIKF